MDTKKAGEQIAQPRRVNEFSFSLELPRKNADDFPPRELTHSERSGQPNISAVVAVCLLLDGIHLSGHYAGGRLITVRIRFIRHLVKRGPPGDEQARKFQTFLQLQQPLFKHFSHKLLSILRIDKRGQFTLVAVHTILTGKFLQCQLFDSGLTQYRQTAIGTTDRLRNLVYQLRYLLRGIPG